MGKDRRSGLWRRILRSTCAWAGLAATANLVVAGTARADLGAEMNSFFSAAGAAANATGPSAYDGKTAGHNSLVNVRKILLQNRVHRRNLTLPQDTGKHK